MHKFVGHQNRYVAIYSIHIDFYRLTETCYYGYDGYSINSIVLPYRHCHFTLLVGHCFMSGYYGYHWLLLFTLSPLPFHFTGWSLFMVITGYSSIVISLYWLVTVYVWLLWLSLVITLLYTLTIQFITGYNLDRKIYKY